MNRALRARIEVIEKLVKPPEPHHVMISFDESDEEFDARLRKLRLEHGLTPNSVLHTVRVRFNGGARGPSGTKGDPGPPAPSIHSWTGGPLGIG